MSPPPAQVQVRQIITVNTMNNIHYFSAPPTSAHAATQSNPTSPSAAISSPRRSPPPAQLLTVPMPSDLPAPLESPKFNAAATDDVSAASMAIPTAAPSPLSSSAASAATVDVLSAAASHLVSRHTPLSSPNSSPRSVPSSSSRAAPLSMAARRRAIAAAALAASQAGQLGFLPHSDSGTDLSLEYEEDAAAAAAGEYDDFDDSAYLDYDGQDDDDDEYDSQEEDDDMDIDDIQSGDLPSPGLSLPSAFDSALSLLHYSTSPPSAAPLTPTADDLVMWSELFLFGHSASSTPTDQPRAFQLLIKAATLYPDTSALGPKIHALLGFCYEFGIGIDQSFTKCEPHYLTAARQNQALAMARLSFLRRYGRPRVRMNRAESEEWQLKVDKLAEAAPLACNATSRLDASPRLLTSGAADPLAWLWWAAGEMHDMSAQYALGTCFHDGVGVARSPEEAVKWYSKSAAQGSPRGEGIMGYCYGEGFGIEKNPALALKYYVSAASKGETVAMYNVGYCYEEGIGVERDLRQAFVWYKKAAEVGNALAANSLGYFYEEGMGMDDKDVVEAVRWYRVAAEQGNPWAEHNIAYMYSTGSGVTKDDVMAFTWYMRAAEQGHAGAQNKLGHCYQNGTGCKLDLELAVYWYRKAAEQRYPQACVSLAWCLDNGAGCRRDQAEALSLLDFAISEGYRDHMIADWYISLAQRVAQDAVGQYTRETLMRICAAQAA